MNKKKEKPMGIVSLYRDYAEKLSGFARIISGNHVAMQQNSDAHIYLYVSVFENQGNLVHLRVQHRCNSTTNHEQHWFDMWVPSQAIACYIKAEDADAKHLGFNID